MAWYTALDKAVGDYLPDLQWICDEPMAKHTSFRIGGPARRMAFPETREQLVVLMGLVLDAGVRPLVIGNGTNLLAADEGLDTVVIDTSARLSRMELTDVIAEVTALYPDGVRTLTPAELDFSYRHSVFSADEGIVLGAKLRLQKGDGGAIKAKMDDLMARRRASQPLELPSAGSTFKRPTGYFAGPLIESCGLKGARIGGAEVSPKHAGFVVNAGGATCADVLALIEMVRKTVYDAHGVLLEPEVKIVR